MPRLIRGFVICAVGGLLTGCGPVSLGDYLNPGNWGGPKGLQMKQAEVPSVVAVDNVRYYSADSALSLQGYRLNLPGEVWQAAYDHTSNAALAGYFVKGNKDYSTKNCRIALVDVARKKAIWATASNGKIEHLVNGAAVIGHMYGPSYGRSQVLNTTSGTFVREAEYNIQVLDDNCVLSLSKDKYARIDLLSGKSLWEERAAPSRGFRKTFRNNDQILVVASDGLEALAIGTGGQWKLKTSTTSVNTGKHVAQKIARSAVASAFGVDYDPNLDQDGAEVTHNACSPPLIVDSVVYFAARKTLFCIDIRTGSPMWQVELPKEFGSMQIVVMGTDVAVVGTGWKYVDFVVRKSVSPGIALYSRANGELRGVTELDKVPVVLDVSADDESVYLLLPGEIRRLSNKLSLTATYVMPADYGQLIRFVRASSGLFVRTVTGVIALEPRTLNKQWYQPGGQLVRAELIGYRGDDEYSDAARPLLQLDMETHHSYVTEETLWLAGQGGVRALDLRSGKLIMNISLSGDATINQHGVVEGIGGTNLTLIPLARNN
jgi:outer membrane protein assembly factor BamB